MSSETENLATFESPQPDPGWLWDRLREWESAHLISHEQSGSILEFEEERAGRVEQAFRYHRMIGIVSAFGGTLLGVGLLLLVASNWADISRLAKVAIAIAAFVAIEGAGYWLNYRTAYHRTGATFLLLGAVAYGGAIFLVGQTYNYPLDDPNLLLLWFLPVLPMAYLVRAQTIVGLAIVVGYGALGYRLAEWLVGSAGRSWDYWWQTAFIVVGVAVTALGYLHQRSETLRPMGRPYQGIGAMTVLALLYLMSFQSLHRPGGLRPGWLDTISLGLGLVFVVAFVTTVVSAALLREKGNRPSLAGIAVPAVSGYLLVALLAFGPFRSSLVPFVLANLLLLAAIMGLVVVGILTRREALVNLSLAVFGIAVISRYIEIGGGMFGTAVSMMLGGVLLIGLGWGLERLRRTLLSRFELRAATDPPRPDALRRSRPHPGRRHRRDGGRPGVDAAAGGNRHQAPNRPRRPPRPVPGGLRRAAIRDQHDPHRRS